MNYIGIDVGKNSSAVCVVDEQGKLVCEREFLTESESFKAFFAKYPDSRSVVEACPLAEWVHRTLKSEGYLIDIVGSRESKKVQTSKKKTDKLDARALAQLARTGWYERVHCKSEDARAFRSLLTARKQLLKTEQALCASIRGLLLANGVKLGVGKGHNFAAEVRASLKGLSMLIKQAIRPMLKIALEASEQLKKNYKLLKRYASKDKTAQLLQTIPSIGPATATAFMSTIDDPRRFSSADKVAGYLGLVPEVHQSGATEYHGRITKQGDGLLRWLLVECAHVLLYRSKGAHPLKEWGLMLAEKKGMAKAKVAVARKLACLLHAVWVSGVPYDLALATVNSEKV